VYDQTQGTSAVFSWFYRYSYKLQILHEVRYFSYIVYFPRLNLM
jgi:hypothetical protein